MWGLFASGSVLILEVLQEAVHSWTRPQILRHLSSLMFRITSYSLLFHWSFKNKSHEALSLLLTLPQGRAGRTLKTSWIPWVKWIGIGPRKNKLDTRKNLVSESYWTCRWQKSWASFLWQWPGYLRRPIKMAAHPKSALNQYLLEGQFAFGPTDSSQILRLLTSALCINLTPYRLIFPCWPVGKYIWSEQKK